MIISSCSCFSACHKCVGLGVLSGVVMLFCDVRKNSVQIVIFLWRGYPTRQYEDTTAAYNHHLKQRDNLTLLHNDPQLQLIFPNKPFLSYKRYPQHKDHLVHTRFNTHERRNPTETGTHRGNNPEGGINKTT